MLNNSNGYSLSDIAAATGNNGGFGFGDGNGWWVILLFLFAFGGWGGNGWGNNAAPQVSADVSAALDANTIKSGISDGFYALNTGVLNGFAGVNAAISGSTAALQSDICNSRINDLQNTFTLASKMDNIAAQQSACCCDLKSNVGADFAALQYQIATEACADRAAVTTGARDIIDNANNNTRQILDFLVQDRLTALTTENQALKGQISQSEQNAYLINALRPAVIPSYTVPNPYAYSGYGYSACGCTGM